MKNVFLILFVIVIIYPVKNFAQFTTVPTKMNTPYGKITVPTQVHAPWMRYNNFSGYVNRKHHFFIVLLNDSIIKAKGVIHIEDSIHYLEWGKMNDKWMIKPSETKQVYRLDGGRRITGMPHDSYWLFPIDTGSIRTYSVLPELDQPLIAYIQKDTSGPLLPFTKENVISLVGDNKKALKLVEKEKLLKAIQEYNTQ
jgi:hypothetical protein